jgi:hypothetical protein
MMGAWGYSAVNQVADANVWMAGDDDLPWEESWYFCLDHTP